MSLARVKTWSVGESLAASDLNGEFNNILNNPMSLISPATSNLDMDGYTLIDPVFKHTPVTFADGDATPAVTGGTVFKTANTTSTTITMFDSGVAGQTIYVLINDSHTTIDFSGTNLSGNAGSDWTASSGDVLQAVFVSPTWYCTLWPIAASGSWTPSLGGTTTYLTQIGRYRKIGTLVHAFGRLSINVLGTGSANVISGLPYAAASSPAMNHVATIGYTQDLATSVVSLSASILATTSSITVYARTAASVSAGAVSIFGNGTIMDFSATYLTN